MEIGVPMSQTIRVSNETYRRLEKHAVGFDTPSNVIEKILDHYEGVNSGVRNNETDALGDRERPIKEKRLYTNKEIQQKITAMARELSADELEVLCDGSESKKLFDINFPLFIKVPSTSNGAFKKAAVKTGDGVARWSWKNEFERTGYIYAVCTQWYPKNDVWVKDWLEQHSVGSK